MSIFQGKPTDSYIERIVDVSKLNEYFFSENALNKDLKERLDENINFIKIEEHLIRKNYKSFALKMADSQYYNKDLSFVNRYSANFSKGSFDSPPL
jgi:hypothetical protein